MAKASFQSIDHYLQSQPPDARKLLQRVRAILKKALPGSVEVISYQMPALRLDGRIIIFFAGWKEHYSLYPVPRGIDSLLENVKFPIEVNTRGTMRFPWDKPPPSRLIAGIAKMRAREIAAGKKAKAHK